MNKIQRSFASISSSSTAWLAPTGSFRFSTAKLSRMWSRTLSVMWSDVEFRFLSSSLGRLLEHAGTYTRPNTFLPPAAERFEENVDIVIPAATEAMAIPAVEVVAMPAVEAMVMPIAAAIDAADSAVSAETRSRIVNEFVVVREDLTLLRELMNDAVGQLSDEFQALITRVKEQDLLIQSMSAKATSGGNGVGGLRAVAKETGEVLTELGQRIERTTLNSTTMARQIDAVGMRIDEVGVLVTGVKKMASRTRLVALNAMIEAAHAGDAGRGFSSVANEVKSLSQNSDTFSDDIVLAVADARKNMTAARGTMTGLVDSDTKFTLAARDRVQSVLAEVGTVNAQLADELDEAANVSRSILNNVSLAETALQFDDMVNQVIEQIETRLQRLEPCVLDGAHAA